MLEERGLEQGLSHDGALQFPVRFMDGDAGMFVAIGFSGPVRGYAVLCGNEAGKLKPIEIRRDAVDWGIRSVRETYTPVSGAVMKLVLDPRAGAEEVLKIVGATHQRTSADRDGYFEFVRVTRKRIEVLFSGAERDDFIRSAGGLEWVEHQYELSHIGGATQIIETATECRLADSPGSSKNCSASSRTSTDKFDGRAFIAR